VGKTGKLPTLTGYEMYKFIRNELDFFDISHHGDHFRVGHMDGRRTTITVSKGKELKKADFSSILRDLEMSRDDFLANYHK
jgi:predicted RNA binding protein YcfA (HicA-like mRNA interferase family)